MCHLYSAWMNSMTGHGRGEAQNDNLKVIAEINSVNRKQLDVGINLPRGFDALEMPLKKLMAQSVSRGRISVKFFVEDHSGQILGQNFNPDVADKHLAALREYAGSRNFSDQMSLSEVARLPGVFESSSTFVEPEEILPVFESALVSAKADFLKSRELEGSHMSEVLGQAIDTIQSLASEVREKAPQVQKHHQKQLKERVERAGLNPESIDPSRLAQEIVIIADRCDVSEELDRLNSHFLKYGKLSTAKGSQGRALDFLAQEIFREINTIGSKANDAGLSHLVVQMKTELEKFREQVQNIE